MTASLVDRDARIKKKREKVRMQLDSTRGWRTPLQVELDELKCLSSKGLVDFAKEEFDMGLDRENGWNWLYAKTAYKVFERHNDGVIAKSARKRMDALDDPAVIAEYKEEEQIMRKTGSKKKGIEKKKESKPRGMGVGAYVMGLFEKHGVDYSDNLAIAEDCTERFGSRTASANISWYRGKFRRENPKAAKAADARKAEKRLNLKKAHSAAKYDAIGKKKAAKAKKKGVKGAKAKKAKAKKKGSK